MPNRLAEESSPYLLQHAENPVDWYPWGDEALGRARAENKPILLSIGYAACHWCHVMERESFTDPGIAGLMNSWFVCIKVDREERPDLDSIYMDAVQAMTGHGGWPMTVFLTPDGKPFYGGTYFPPEDRHGLPGFPRLLGAVHDAWMNKRDDIETQAGNLAAHIGATTAPKHDREHDPTDVTLRAAVAALRESFDPDWGGFGNAPKFPQPMVLEFLLRMHVRGEPDALSMATTTLQRMGRGGIFDQLGGGFHRYSTDREWLVPHFEKMLYDNGQLLRTYARAWLVTREPLFRRTAELTAEWMIREMRHAEGGFFSSQDADSEGVEGKYYVWSRSELGAAAEALGATESGNWEGTNVLTLPSEPISDKARQALLATRAQRIAPSVDDKILASWNGLAISGLCEAARAFGRTDFAEAAVATGRFVLGALRRSDGRLLRSWRDGRTSGPGFLDDYALVSAACLDLYETTFDESWFVEARRLAEAAIDLFADPAGGFFDVGSDAPRVLHRPKDLFDNAVPSGGAAMAEVLLRLGALTGDPTYEMRVEPSLKSLQPALASAPGGFGAWLGALDLLLARAREIAIAGKPDGVDTRALVDVVWGRYVPNRVLAVGSDGAVPLLAGRNPTGGKATAYVCEGFVCLNPVSSPAELASLLEAEIPR